MKPVARILGAWCKTHGLPAPELEYRFHPIRKWRFDFAWKEQKVAVECHGSVWVAGHHTRGQGFLDDREKMNTALSLGWRVFEVGSPGKHPATLYSNELAQWLKAVLIA